MERDAGATDRLGAALGELLDRSQQLRPSELPDLVEHTARELGARSTQIWLVDHQQRALAPLGGAQSEAVPIEGTMAGRAFTSAAVTRGTREDGHARTWFPLLDGVDRVGVLEVLAADLDDESVLALSRLAALTAAELVTRGQYTDLFTMARRQRPLALAAELQWQLLPPPSFSNPEVAVAGMLEPAYDVGGDAFDYACDEHHLAFALFDAVGHGLGSSLISTLTVGTYRNSRRSGRDLRSTVMDIDQAIAEQFSDYRFSTGIIGTVDVAAGRLEWINCGHPPPLLLRAGRIIGLVEHRHRVPLGLGWLVPGEPEVGTLDLEPGDGVLLFTDGVVEAKRRHGIDFGMERLEELLHKAAAAELAPAETVRRLTAAVLDHHRGELHDDATTLLITWRGHP